MKGFIYRIYDNTNGNVYYGSTFQGVSQRIADHRSNYKQYLKGKCRNVKSFDTFDCIVHAGANTDVEACESDWEKCYRDNTLLTEILAIEASQAKCKFVYISSTGIYGNEKYDTTRKIYFSNQKQKK